MLQHRRLVGNRIRDARRARGLTQNELAALINADVKTISRAENGRYAISVDLVATIARALDVPSSNLFP